MPAQKTGAACHRDIHIHLSLHVDIYTVPHLPKRKTPEHRGGKGDRDAVYYKNIDPKKNTERFNIFLDEKYAFSVDADVLVRFDLKKGKELDELDILEIQHGDDVKKPLTAP